MVTIRRRQARSARTVAAASLIAALALIAAEPAAAQTRSASTWNLALSAPPASTDLIGRGDGLSWDSFRKNGLVLTARGTGEARMVVHALTFENGRLIDRWTSKPFTAAAGRKPLSGSYLPAVQKDAQVASITAGRPMALDEARNARSPDVFAGAGGEGTFLVMFSGTYSASLGSGTNTSAIAVALEVVSEQ